MAWIRKFAMATDLRDMKAYIGRAVRVKDDDGNLRVIECEEILGSLRWPTKFQINYRDKSYLISMLDFFAQMNGERVSEDEIKAFDDTVFFVEERKNPFPFLHSPKGKLWKPKK